MAGARGEQIEKVATISKRMPFRAGTVLGKAGEKGDQVFIIIRGEAQLTANSAVGEITVRIAGPGESWPLAALVGLGTLITSAKALTDMEVLSVPRHHLLGLCSRNTRMAWRIFGNVAETLTNRYGRTLSHLTLSEEAVLKADIERSEA